MGDETATWYNNNIITGFTAKRGEAWWKRDGLTRADFTNSYPGAIPADAIMADLFGWTTLEQPIFWQSDMGMMPIEGKKALVRSDNGHVMSIVGEGYKVHPYGEWLIKNLDRLVDGHAAYANAGLLKGGAVAWVQIETPENIMTAGGVEFRPSILAGTSFDGSLATFYKPVITNVVCDNTMAGALGEAGPIYRKRHTKNSSFVIGDARAALSMLAETAENVAKRIDALTNIDVTEKQWSDFVVAHVPVKEGASKNGQTLADNKRQALTGLWRTDMRVAPWSGTAWGVIQAVNTYTEHMSIVRNAQRFERKISRAIGDELTEQENGTIRTLGEAMGRELVTV